MVKMIKKELKTTRGRLVLLMSVALIASFFIIGMVSKTSATVTNLELIRNIEIEIRDMAFATDNPTVYLRAGETVRFIITNLDEGMIHDFSIEGTDVRTRIMNYGEQDSVIFQVPPSADDMVYLCTLHILTMRGSLSISTDINVALLKSSPGLIYN